MPAQWGMIGWLGMLCFVSHLNRLAISVAGTEKIIPQFNLGETAMGVVYTSYLAVYTAAMIVGGWFIDRFGPRTMLVVMGLGSAAFGALTGAIGFAALTAAQLISAFIVVRGAMGLFTTPLHPACARAAASFLPPHRVSLGNGLITFGAVLGMSSTSWVFGKLMDWLDWPGAFITVAVAFIILTLGWALVSSDRGLRTRPGEADAVAHGDSPTKPVAAAHGQSASGVIGLLLEKNLLLLTLSYAAVGYFQYLFFYWAEYYFKDVLHLSVNESRNYTTVLILALGIGMPLGGLLAGWAQRRFPGRLGWALTPALGMGLSAAFLFFGLTPRDPLWIVILFALAMGALGLSESSFWQAAVHLGRHRGATAAAIINTGGNGIGLLAPLLTPWISYHFGWAMGLCLGGVVSVLGALCWLGINPDSRAVTVRGSVIDEGAPVVRDQ